MPTRIANSNSRIAKAKKTKMTVPPKRRLLEDPELVYAAVQRLQNDIRELMLARNSLKGRIEDVEKAIATLQKSDPFADAKATLAKYSVGNLRPKDILSTSGSTSSKRVLSVDEEIKLLRTFLDKNKFNQASVEASIRELDGLLKEGKEKVDKIPLAHRETATDKRVVLQGIEQEIHEQQMLLDERRMAREVKEEKHRVEARHIREELEEVCSALIFVALLRPLSTKLPAICDATLGC